MNTRCDTLAKRAVHRAISTGMRREGKQLLPSEDESVFVNSRKLTRDLATVRTTIPRDEKILYSILVKKTVIPIFYAEFSYN